MHIRTPTERARQFWHDKPVKKWVVTVRTRAGLGLRSNSSRYHERYARARSAERAAQVVLESGPEHGFPVVTSVRLADPVDDLGGVAV